MHMNVVEGLVSIVVPFYNSGEFIREALDSVLTQTYPHWELILVDDGSEDDSTQIAHSYADSYPDKIRYYEHPGHANLKAARTRNYGASFARGEFIAFLDSDDIWLPSKLIDQISLLRAHPEVGLVFAPSLYWYDWDERASAADSSRNYVPEVGPPGLIKNSSILLIHGYPIGKWGAPCPSSLLIRRSTFEKVGGFAGEFKRLFEDVAFLGKIYVSGTQVYISEKTMDYYRCREDSVWHRIKGTAEEEVDRAFYFRWLYRYLREIGCKDPAIWKAVRREGWMYWLPLPTSITGILRRIIHKGHMILR